MSGFEIRRFRDGDEAALSVLIRRAFFEINIRDYTPEGLRYWNDLYTPAHVLSVSRKGHMYVAEEDGTLVGVCSISRKNPSEGLTGDAKIESLYLLPGRTGEGIASALLKTCERDPSFSAARRIWTDSSITARLFYEKRGYRHETGAPVCIENDRYIMYKETMG